MMDGKKNFSLSSCDHCFLKLDGRIIKIFLFLSAQNCESKIPASIVFPRPTSSAKIAPFERGDLKAKRAAST